MESLHACSSLSFEVNAVGKALLLLFRDTARLLSAQVLVQRLELLVLVFNSNVVRLFIKHSAPISPPTPLNSKTPSPTHRLALGIARVQVGAVLQQQLGAIDRLAAVQRRVHLVVPCKSAQHHVSYKNPPSLRNKCPPTEFGVRAARQQEHDELHVVVAHRRLSVSVASTRQQPPIPPAIQPNI